MKNLLLADRSKLASLIRMASLVVAFASIFILFATGIRMTVDSSPSNVVTTYGPAFSFVFGGKLSSEHATYSLKAPCGICLVAFIIYVLALIVSSFGVILPMIGKDKKFVLLGIVGSLMALVASIMFLSSRRSVATALSIALLGEYSESVANTIYGCTSLEFGFIGIGVFGIIASLAFIATFFLDGTAGNAVDLIGKRMAGEKGNNGKRQ